MSGSRVKRITQLGLHRWCAGDEDCNPTLDGREYIGHTAVTVSGRPCQAWASQSPHSHHFTQDYMYPDGSVAAAGNYCRNPDHEWDAGVWCYTNDSDTRWELCVVPLCGQSLCYVKCSLYSIAERRFPERIPVLGSQPAGDVSHEPGGRLQYYFPPGLQLPPQPLRGLLPILLLGEQRHNGCEQFA